MTAEITKAPPWHGWVTFDLFFSSASAGTYLATAAILLIVPSSRMTLVTWSFAIAFLIILVDLVCLIEDLGDPLRFHHMMRVFKPGSPMSLGVWSIASFSFFSFATAAMSVLGLSPGLIKLVAAVGVIPAILVANYKGVLLSATAQPGWRDMRWLSAAMSASAGLLGFSIVAATAALTGEWAIAGQLVTVVFAIVPIYALARASVLPAEHRALGRGPMDIDRLEVSEAISIIAVAIAAGVNRHLLLLAPAIAALVVAGGLAFRDRLVRLPHRAN